MCSEHHNAVKELKLQWRKSNWQLAKFIVIHCLCLIAGIASCIYFWTPIDFNCWSVVCRIWEVLFYRIFAAYFVLGWPLIWLLKVDGGKDFQWRKELRKRFAELKKQEEDSKLGK